MFSKAVKLFSIAGLEIRLDPSWLMIAGLIVWSLSQGYFPSVLPQLSPQTYLWMAVLATILLFASLILHEMAHSLIARRLGLPVKRITLFLFGGVAELGTEPQSARVEFWVALAGPAMSLCLSFGFWALSRLMALSATPPVLLAILSYLAVINLVLAVFNMVPAFPLDGGRVLRAYLWQRKGDVLRATQIASKSGAFFAYVLMALGLAVLFQGAIIAGLWQMLIGGFVLIAARSAYQNQLAQTVFDDKQVKTLMTPAPVVVSPDMTLSDFVDRILLHRHLSFAPVVEDGVLLGHMDQTLLSGIDREHWPSTRVGDVFAGLDAQTQTAPDVAIKDLMQVIAKTGQRKFLVTEAHRLVGVITLSDLMQHLHKAEGLFDGR
jgi:Zn-dependent protease